MTKDEFKPIIKLLKTAYKRDGFLTDQSDYAFWLEMLRDLKAEDVMDSVKQYIMGNVFQPTIADIRKPCEAKMEQNSKYRAEMREIFETAIGGYAGFNKMQSNTMMYWNYLTAAGTWEKRVQKAKRLEQKISEYVRSCELDGTINDIMTFTQYLEEQYREFLSRAEHYRIHSSEK